MTRLARFVEWVGSTILSVVRWIARKLEQVVGAFFVAAMLLMNYFRTPRRRNR